MHFVIEFSETVKDDMKWIDKKHHQSIRESIIEQLQYQPNVETRNRKPLDPSIREADWELRCGEKNRYRVLYRFWLDEAVTKENHNQNGTVLITAIGEKKNERLWIGGGKI